MKNKFSQIHRYFAQVDNEVAKPEKARSELGDPKQQLNNILERLKTKTYKGNNLQPNIFNSYMDNNICNQSSFTTNPLKWLKDKGNLSHSVNDLLNDLNEEAEVQSAINNLSILELKKLTTTLDQMNSIEISSLMSMEPESKVAIINDLLMTS